MELRIKITEIEFNDLQERTKAAGYPTVNAYHRSLLFPLHDHVAKWNEAKSKIVKLKSGDEFLLRDLLPNTPSNIGVWLFEQQSSLGIECIGKFRGVNKFRKL
jgi:hypothetical protein